METGAKCSTRILRGWAVSRWYDKHVNDPYVKRAQVEGYRSRAVYKLLEIDEREKLIKKGQSILDLGSTPGGWSQVCAKRVGPSGRVLALDLLPMTPIEGVRFEKLDFTEDSALEWVETQSKGGIDLVLSDMAPNITGVRSVDLPRAMYLAELAVDTAKRVLKPGGAFLTKLFHGEGFDDYVKSIRADFEYVKVRKPAASRPKSRETYLVARNYRL
ncbi:MAG: RlmE family RNA methyltransferase [Gammaproteobacteria bacterium]